LTLLISAAPRFGGPIVQDVIGCFYGRALRLSAEV
jgi:hypothetical protein